MSSGHRLPLHSLSVLAKGVVSSDLQDLGHYSSKRIIISWISVQHFVRHPFWEEFTHLFFFLSTKHLKSLDALISPHIRIRMLYCRTANWTVPGPPLCLSLPLDGATEIKLTSWSAVEVAMDDCFSQGVCQGTSRSSS